MTSEAIVGGRQVTDGPAVSTEFKLGLVEAYLAGRGSINRLATEGGINHSLLHDWLGEYERGEWAVELQHEDDLREAERQVAALERR